MKKKIGVIFALIVFAMNLVGCSEKKEAENSSEPVLQEETNTATETAQETEPEISDNVAAEEVDESALIPEDFQGLKAYSRLNDDQKKAIDELRESLKNPIHVESDEMLSKMSDELYIFPKSYCTVDGITPDYMLALNSYMGWKNIANVKDSEEINDLKKPDDFPVLLYTYFDDPNIRYTISYTDSEMTDFELSIFLPGYRSELYDIQIVDPSEKFDISLMKWIEKDGVYNIAGSCNFMMKIASDDYNRDDINALELKISPKQF